MLLPVVVAGPPVRAQNVSDEYRLKAAIVFRFPQFVEWPPQALQGRTTLDFCVLEPSPFGRVLDELVDGEALAGRSLKVRLIRPAGALETCHVLFLPSGGADRRAVLKRVATIPVLTVSDDASFLDEGGIVQLRVVSNRVRFEISAAAAHKARLRLSSQLMRLAIGVRGDTP
jgi:hypothetical protein